MLMPNPTRKVSSSDAIRMNNTRMAELLNFPRRLLIFLEYLIYNTLIHIRVMRENEFEKTAPDASPS